MPKPSGMFEPHHALAARVFNHTLVAPPLSRTAFHVLAKVHAAEGIAQSMLARCTGVTPPTLTRILARLGRAGLVRQVPSPTDRRVRFVRMTPLGRRAMEVVHETIFGAEVDRVAWQRG